MLDTIEALRSRIEELECAHAPDPSRIYLNQPYGPGSQGTGTPDIPDLGGLNLTHGRLNPMDMQEPPSHLIAALVDTFLERFANSGYFFLPSAPFRASALLALPFGHQHRPSRSLLSAVYLWGSALSHIRPNEPYTPDAFLVCAVENIPQDICRLSGNPQLIVETIQAEILLSFYYLHIADPFLGRYHASAASSIALGAEFHLVRSPQYMTAYPSFAVHASLPASRNTAQEAVRIDAFWAVNIINNYWAAANSSPSPIPSTIIVDSPWPSSSQGGSTIVKFLNGNDDHGSSPVSLLTKASILLERIIAFLARTAGPPDPASLASLDRRLHTFQAALPPLPGPQTLVLTHGLVDLAIVRLHAPYTRNSETARTKCLSAAARVVVGARAVNILDGARNTDPMFGPIYAGVASVYMNEITALAHHSGGRSPRAQAQARELETRLGTLMSAMASLAAYSPLIERCFVEMRAEPCLHRDSWVCPPQATPASPRRTLLYWLYYCITYRYAALHNG